MANNLNGFLAVYAQKSLDQLIAKAPLLSAFTTDFSDAIVDGGTSVTTRLANSTYTANDTDANGYIAQDASSSAVTVTLKQRDNTVSFSELQWATMTPTVLQNTILPGLVGGLVNSISQDAMALITSGSYATSVVSPAASFSGSKVANIAQTLSTANVDIEGRSLIVLPTLYETFVNTVSAAYNLGTSDLIQGYRTSKAYGFSIFEYSGVPANDQNLVGFATSKAAIAIAMRAPIVSDNTNILSQNAVDPSTGMSIQVRIWHDATKGRHFLSVVSIYGVSVGNTGALVRIKSA
jgi:hypothetical protein